jgi:type I restriction enzyme, S subunit
VIAERALGDVAIIAKESQDPKVFGNAAVRHFSIPAFDLAAEPEVVPASEIRSNKLRLDRPTVLLSKINPHIPRCWLAEPAADLPSLASTEFLPLIPREGRVDLAYLYAVCSSRPFQRQLMTLVTGTSTSHQRVKPRDCLAIKIPIPVAAKQRRIGEVFRSLTYRLAITTKIAQVTNDLIRASFRDTFGTGQGSEQLSRVADISFGVSYRSSELEGRDQALVTLKCFGRMGNYRSEGLKPWSGAPKPNQLLNPGDVVVAQTDLTQAADVLGRAAIVRRSAQFERLVASLDVAVVRPSSRVTRGYLYGLLCQPEFRAYCRSRSNGTTVLHLSRKALPEYRVAIPDARSSVAYDGLVDPLIARLLVADDEKRALAQMRAAFIEEALGH